MEVDPEISRRRERILRVLREMPLDDALLRDGFPEDLEAEAESSERGDQTALITRPVLDDYKQFAPYWRTRKSLTLTATRGARVIVVPGFMGSALSDTTGGHGLIWVDPMLALNGGQLAALQLTDNVQSPELDFLHGSSVNIKPSGCIPLAYDLLGWFLWMNGYSVTYAPFDWRKQLDESARQLEQMIRDQFVKTSSQVRIIAHSQGSLVARRAIQLLGPVDALQMVQTLVLLGPATYGTYSAPLAISGNHAQIEQFRRWALGAPDGIAQVFQSMTGLYQLIPWNVEKQIPEEDLSLLKKMTFWKTGIDEARLASFVGWAKQIDARFFNDRTRVILGDAETIDRVDFQGGKLTPVAMTKEGDGTVPDRFAKIPGVLTFKAPKATHALMGANYVVCKAVVNLLGGHTPSFLAPKQMRTSIAGAGPVDQQVLTLVDDRKRAVEPPRHIQTQADNVAVTLPVEAASTVRTSPMGTMLAAPLYRRLRVFALDPLLSISVDTADYAEMTIELNWNDVGTLPAPVGEYLEVVDVDPQSGRYYPPLDLNHPYILAENGLKPSEQNPQFHQQMTFAVAMATIRVFEKALGRLALWSPYLQRDEYNNVINQTPESQYVPRLRIYPHAMRQQNAYYDPDCKALLFGYFPAEGALGTRVANGGTIFTSSSFDIIAHETTHALLDGLHRYLIYDSNRDVLAFHEGFADIVALLQRFSNTDFLRAQIVRSGGDITGESILGQLAGQFAEGTGGHGNGLRQYLGTFQKDGTWKVTQPDPAFYQDETECHARGAILVAVIFRILTKIYQRRAADLFRIANRLSPAVDLAGQPDLVNRLAFEASKSAAHLLRMCVRALDYLPPFDVTMGEYLRAMITADFDLVRDDDYRYRVAVVDAFREWGISPSQSNTLLESDLLWTSPTNDPLPNLIKWVEKERLAGNFADWVVGADRRRAFGSRATLGENLHKWIVENIPPDYGASLGLCLHPELAPPSIKRGQGGIPSFEIHAVHPCSRIGPDGQQLQDLVIEIVQRRKVFFDSSIQARLDGGELPYDQCPRVPDFYFRGGCTLVLDGRNGAIRYAIHKNIKSQSRLEMETEYRRNPGRPQLGMTYFDSDEKSPFRSLHQDAR